jgi:Domain of unknown function DUF11
MRRAGCLVVLVVLVTALAGASPASASHIRYVTFAARYCPTYAAINANEARNNIQESLQPLGADTPYGPNDAMDPVVEEKNQPLCKPLGGWKFTLGTGYQSRAVPGPWGNLSKVTGAYADAPPASPNPVTTLASTPLLNPSGLKTEGTIAGAVTLRLTEDQVEQASKANNLWVMGGTPTDPVATPADYAFGALRCGVDNLNGDNVEWVTFPSNSYHVFCFAYYVTPPPPAGTIIVRKRLTTPAGAPDVPSQTFRFTGNLSFTPNPADPTNPQSNYFNVSGGDSEAEVVSGQATFPRAAGSTWTVRETPPPSSSATFDKVECTSSNSTVTKNPANPGEVSIALGAGDVVTCTYTNNVVFAAGLYLSKITTGGVGTFDFTANPDTGSTATRTITTTKEGIPAAASAITARAGDRYTITESPPKRDDGHWELASATCGGQTVSDRPVRTTIPASGIQFCTFTNRFVPTGSIIIRKVTVGATATAAFVISPDFGTPATYAQSATTTHEGTPATLAAGDDTTALPLGTYLIREMTPSPGPVPGSWRLAAAICNGTPVATAGGGASVTLTRDRPKIDCTVTNEFVPVPEPAPQPPTPQPPIPTPTPLPTAPIDFGNVVAAGTLSPLANLVVTKVATPRRVIVGGKVRYRVTVRNRGPATARAVTVVERQAYGNRSLTLSASQGHCRGTPPRFCVIGTLAPGSSATVTVTVRTRRTGRFRNVVAANQSTPDPALGANTASATITVVRRPRPHFTG